MDGLDSGGSNPLNGAGGILVRAVGVEPTLLSEPDFESGASANSATPACALVISPHWKACIRFLMGMRIAPTGAR